MADDTLKVALEGLINGCAWAHKRGDEDFPNPTDVNKVLLQVSMIKAYRALGFTDEELEGYFSDRAWRTLREGIKVVGRPKEKDNG